MKYKIGDKVRIKSKDFFEKANRLQESNFVFEMYLCCNKEAIITNIKKAYLHNWYIFSLDFEVFLPKLFPYREWKWNEWMFEKVDKTDNKGNYLLNF